MTGHVVPLDAIVVEVVQDREAGLVVALGGLAVVRLRLIVASGMRPIAGVSLRGGPNLRPGARPEPAVFVRWLQIWTIASCEVALAS